MNQRIEKLLGKEFVERMLGKEDSKEQLATLEAAAATAEVPPQSVAIWPSLQSARECRMQS